MICFCHVSESGVTKTLPIIVLLSRAKLMFLARKPVVALSVRVNQLLWVVCARGAEAMQGVHRLVVSTEAWKCHHQDSKQ